MASLEQLGIRREQIGIRLEKAVNGLLEKASLEPDFTLQIQERDQTLLYLKQLEALTEKLEAISNPKVEEVVTDLKDKLETKVQEAAKVSGKKETQPVLVEVTPEESK